MRELPTGTVTLLFTDIEGSTKLLHELGAEGYEHALLEHRRILRDAVGHHAGVEVDTQGDSFFVAFPTAPEGLAAAAEAQDALVAGPIRVRIGLHTGQPHLGAQGYVGTDVHKGARIAAAGHGGQVLLSKETRDVVAREEGAQHPDLLDLGEHRVKDFAAPVWIFQLGRQPFPPLRTISNTNLPRPASSFIGREREVGEIAALLRDGARLLSLTGPGGTGKTRLAIEAAAELVPDFRNGVFWVGLAALRDPALVTPAIAHTLGAKDGLADHIGEREMLLLLDNLEQVVEAASELAALVEACPNLRLLSTSRELLRVRGEVEYAVLPLAEPEAVDLFCARAGIEPDEAVHALCRALDNLPLALELAAARASVLSPKQILERLSQRLDLLKGGRDADPRQQTLRATIEWSYELLTPAEQRLFARLAVFRGGCTLDAAEEVADAELDTLQSLVHKSLMRHTDERFSMLETIRDYAVERLEDSGEAEEFRRRHAAHFLALAEQAEPNLREEVPRSTAEWLDRLEREHDNLRAALERLEASGETQLALRLAGAAWWFWDARSYLVEGRRRLESALRADARPTAARARALNGAGEIAINAGDITAARLWAEEALPLHRAFGDAWGTAYSAHLFGHATLDEGDLHKARPLIEESVRLFRELGDQHHNLFATHLLAWNCYRLGDTERARTLWEDNLQRARATGNRNIEALALGALADNLALEEGRVEDALPMLTEAYRINRDLGMPSAQTAMDLHRFARGLALAGRATAAARVFACAEALYEEIGARARPLTAERDEETLSSIRTQLSDSAFAEAWEQGRLLTADEAVALAFGETP
jgi:predicted ATPase/class 3 adenylate cyclase